MLSISPWVDPEPQRHLLGVAGPQLTSGKPHCACPVSGAAGRVRPGHRLLSGPQGRSISASGSCQAAPQPPCTWPTGSWSLPFTRLLPLAHEEEASQVELPGHAPEPRRLVSPCRLASHGPVTGHIADRRDTQLVTYTLSLPRIRGLEVSISNFGIPASLWVVLWVPLLEH